MYFDSYYLLLVVPAIIFTMFAQSKVNSTFQQYSKRYTRSGITGAEAAALVLRQNGIYDVKIERVSGNLTDHYDPRTNVIRLSDSVYGQNTVAAVGVAAHEAGHAVQYAQGYFAIRVRTAILPVTQIGSKLALPLLMIGLLLNFEGLFVAGILFFVLATFFQLITLPVEYNASSRAVAAISESGCLGEDEVPGTRKVLNAAALTYVAALAVSLAQLFRLLLLFGRSNRDD
jgi:Zn-dependent membrane protease YugP